MDIALTYNPSIGMLDISLAAGDLAVEDTLSTAVMLSLFCDRLAQPHEVPPGHDRRGYWADAYAATPGDLTGSRLWLLQRSKQLPATVQTARGYIKEALQWMLDDGMVQSMDVTGFVPQSGWLYVDAVLYLVGGSRKFRFEWSDEQQVWRLGAETFSGVSRAN